MRSCDVTGSDVTGTGRGEPEPEMKGRSFPAQIQIFPAKIQIFPPKIQIDQWERFPPKIYRLILRTNRKPPFLSNAFAQSLFGRANRRST